MTKPIMQKVLEIVLSIEILLNHQLSSILYIFCDIWTSQLNAAYQTPYVCIK